MKACERLHSWIEVGFKHGSSWNFLTSLLVVVYKPMGLKTKFFPPPKDTSNKLSDWMVTEGFPCPHLCSVMLSRLHLRALPFE